MDRQLADQVTVVTGASSGIGRETALEFARHGSRLVLAARNEEALHAARREIERLGAQALVVPTDVSKWEQVEALARQAVEQFDRIDTWVNAAAVSLYGTVEQVTAEEMARVIEVNLLGQVYGMKAAVTQMREQGSGVIIDVASVLGKRAVPLQAAYSAAKAGIIRFSEALRMELAQAGLDIHVTTLIVSSINTPLFEHARSKLGVLPMPMPPVYEPGVVARTIVEIAQRPRREVVVGGAGKALTVAQRISPAMVDKLLLGPGKVFKKQKTSQPENGRDNLEHPMDGPGSTTGQFGSRSKSTSLYTEKLELHPWRLRALALGAVAVVAGGLLREMRR